MIQTCLTHKRELEQNFVCLHFATGLVFLKKLLNLQLCLNEEEEEEEENGLGEFGLRDPRGDAVDADLQVLQKNTFNIFILFIGTIKNIPKCLICLKAL